jgi:hypothetical protein
MPGNCAETPVVEIAHRVRLSASPNGTSREWARFRLSGEGAIKRSEVTDEPDVAHARERPQTMLTDGILALNHRLDDGFKPSQPYFCCARLSHL